MKTNSIIKSVLFVVGFSALALIGSAQAQVVNVDVNATGSNNAVVFGSGNSGTYSGVGAASDTGTYWNGLTVQNQATVGGNQVHTYTISNLQNSTNTANTGESLTLSTSSNMDAGDYGLNPNTFAPALLNDYAQPGSGSLTFTIGGLTTGDTYNLFFYSQTAKYNNGGGTFTIGSTVLTANNLTTGTSGDLSGFVNGGNYVEFTGEIASGSQIIGTLTGSGGNSDIFDGVQIVNTTVAAPEPTSVALIGLGALALLINRRRLASLIS